MEESLTGFPMFIFGNLLLLIITETVIFAHFPNALNSLIYQDTLVKIFGDYINKIYFIIFILCPILFVFLYRKFDINMNIKKDPKYSNNLSILYGILFFTNLANLIPYIIFSFIRKSLRYKIEYRKYLSDSFINSEASNCFLSYLKSRYKYVNHVNLAFENKSIAIYSEDDINSYIAYCLRQYDMFWSSFLYLEGKKEVLEHILQYLDSEGMILLKKCYSKFSTDKELQIFLLYKSIIQCQSLEYIETLNNEVIEIESGMSDVHYIEKALISSKILYLKNELFLTECLCLFEYFISRIYSDGSNLSDYELNIISNINDVKKRIIRNEEIRIVDETTKNNILAIKKSIEILGYSILNLKSVMNRE